VKTIKKLDNSNTSKMQAPIGQDPNNFRQEKKTKINIRFEFDQNLDKKLKKDVHAGTIVNPLV